MKKTPLGNSERFKALKSQLSSRKTMMEGETVVGLDKKKQSALDRQVSARHSSKGKKGY